MVDRVLQEMAGYKLVMEWTVLGTRTMFEEEGDKGAAIALEFGDVTALRIDPPPEPTGKFTVNFNGERTLESTGDPVRVIFPPKRYDPVLEKQASVLTFWACNYHV